MPATDFLTEDEWETLIADVQSGNVIPVVGPGLVTVKDEAAADAAVPLERRLAPPFAKALGLPNESEFASLGSVARRFLAQSDDRARGRKKLFQCLKPLLDNLNEHPSAALRSLAAVKSFNVFLATTADPLLAQAIRETRGAPEVVRFHPRGKGAASLNNPAGQKNPVGDIPNPPDEIQGPLVYHIFGDFKLMDWALVDEDYVEFVCGLLQGRDTLENLFSLINDPNRNLLLFGAPAEDWIVRFFLRATYSGRLSERTNFPYIVDPSRELGDQLVQYYQKATRETRFINGSPVEFAQQLAARWRKANGEPDEPANVFGTRQLEAIPPGAVFLSYSRADEVKAKQVAAELNRLNVPVWFDQQQLGGGAAYNPIIEAFVREGCSFFISLISQTTESSPGSYAQKERQWAAERCFAGMGVFYLPLILDDTPKGPKQGEPKIFWEISQESFDNLEPFAAKVAALHREFMRTRVRPTHY